MYDKENVLVFDVGGSHIASALFDSTAAMLTHISERPSNSALSADEFVHTLLDLCDKSNLSPPITRTCVAMPSPFDYDAGISYMRHKYRNLFGLDLRTRISSALDLAPDRVLFINDARAFLLGEIACGAASGANRVVGITLGTGIGSAFAVDGNVQVHGTGIPPAGEIWNMSYQHATVEHFISTKAIQQLYEDSTGTHRSVREIAELARVEHSAREVFVTFGRNLGQILRETCYDFAPRRIVFGGGIAKSAALFLPFAIEALNEPSIELRSSALKFPALIGAGICCRREQTNEVGSV